MRILVVGGVSYDDIVHLNDFFAPDPATIFVSESYQSAGSTGTGKALAFRSLGHEVAFIARIGNDHYGEMLEELFVGKGIDFHPVRVDRTERHTNLMNRKGERISIFTQMASPMQNPDLSVYDHLIDNCDIVCLNIIDWCRGLIPMIKKAGKPIYCDLHDYDLGNPYHQDFLEAADGVFLSTEKLADHHLFMKTQMDKGKTWVVATHGSAGASGITGGSAIVDIPATKVRIVDTNGAGDNFFAGFVHALAKGKGLYDAFLTGRLAADSCIASREIVSEELNAEYLEENLAKLKKNS